MHTVHIYANANRSIKFDLKQGRKQVKDARDVPDTKKAGYPAGYSKFQLFFVKFTIINSSIYHVIHIFFSFSPINFPVFQQKLVN